MTIFNCFFVGNLNPLWCKYDLYYLELKLKYFEYDNQWDSIGIVQIN